MAKGNKKKSRRGSTGAASKATKEGCTVKIPELAILVMGEHSSGHSDTSKLKHAVIHTDDETKGVIVGIDVAVTDDKVGGKDWLNKLAKEDASMTEKEWTKLFRATGNKTVIKDAKKDLFIRVVNPEVFFAGSDQDKLRKEVITKLVDAVTNHEDPLLPLYYENGESCSSGGYSQRAEKLLCDIPFFKKFYKTINSNFDIRQTWCRASAKGTHDKHSDSFSTGATHRIILFINCYGKEMQFSY